MHNVHTETQPYSTMMVVEVLIFVGFVLAHQGKCCNTTAVTDAVGLVFIISVPGCENKLSKVPDTECAKN